MKDNFINLTDGTRLEIKVNFGTLYYLQKQNGFFGLARKAENQKLNDMDSFELAAEIIYALLRSNGKVVSFDEALRLIPPDTEEIENVFRNFQEEYDKYAKKKATKQKSIPPRLK